MVTAHHHARPPRALPLCLPRHPPCSTEVWQSSGQMSSRASRAGGQSQTEAQCRSTWACSPSQPLLPCLATELCDSSLPFWKGGKGCSTKWDRYRTFSPSPSPHLRLPQGFSVCFHPGKLLLPGDSKKAIRARSQGKYSKGTLVSDLLGLAGVGG